MAADPMDREFEQMQGEIEAEERLKASRAHLREQFPPITLDGVSRVLSTTIKGDPENALITFLACLGTYSDDSALNVSFTGPTSSGKTFIPQQVVALFPEQDVMKFGFCSPASFCHENGTWDEKRKCRVIDLERKILVFLDQPHPQLLQRFRPLLSHDERQLLLMVTDRTQRFGYRSKHIVMRGFPSVIFCSTNLKLDPQETSRFLLLSPETTSAQIQLGISEAVAQESDPDSYCQRLGSDPERQLLKCRIVAIRDEHIRTVVIPDGDYVEKRFLRDISILKPRHQRDVKRLCALTRAVALLNAWHRETGGDPRVLIASMDDIEAAFKVYGRVSLCQELGLPPHAYKVYREVFLPLHRKSRCGFTRTDVMREHHALYGTPLNWWTLSRELLPMLEDAGLVYQKDDPGDKRQKRIFCVESAGTATGNGSAATDRPQSGRRKN